MREILFRGFHPCDGPEIIVVDGEKVVGRWVQGSLVSFADGGRAILPSKTVVLQQEGTTLLLTKESLEVILSTVGQYTGLTDKNGKRIFEGDIVTTDLKRPYLIVEFRDACFMFNCNDGDKDYYDIFLPITNTAHTEYQYGEVIGTIFDEVAQHEN
mgnify:CR=1 FL=1